MIYEYVRIRVPPGGWPDAAATIFGPFRKDLERDDGRIYGVFRALIGAPMNEGVIITAHQDVESWAEYRRGEKIHVHEGVERLDSVLLAPSVRPAPGATADAPGVYAHRWFDIEPGSWPEFVRLSEEGWWPAVEGAGAHVQGLWSALGGAAEGHAFLLTRYDSMAHWEATRFSTPESQAGLSEQARHAMARRAAITLRSTVRIMTPVRPG
jgi:hypothetical protein